MCLLCAAGSQDADLARRTHVLRLLSLIERPGALPADANLRLAREILALTQARGTPFRCEAVAPPDADADPHTAGVRP